MENITTKLVLCFVLLGLLFILFVYGYSNMTGKLLYALLIFINGLLILRSLLIKNYIVLIISTYILLYIQVLYFLFYKNIQLSVFVDFNNEFYFYKSACIICLFLILFYLFLRIYPDDKLMYFQNKDSNAVFLFSVISFSLMMIFGLNGENILESGGYGKGESNGSFLFEYGLIFFCAAYLYSGNSIKKKRLLLLLSVLYVLKSLLYGGRIAVLELMLAWFFLYFQYRIKLKTILLFVCFFYYSMLIIGALRSDITLLSSLNIIDILTMDKKGSVPDMIVSQEADANYAAVRLIAFADEQIVIFTDRIYSLFLFVCSIFLPYSILPSCARPADMLREYPTGGGGLITAYFYFYASYIGVIFIAIYMAISLSVKRGNIALKYNNLYLMFLFITLPRWFAYNPISIFKMSLYGVFIIKFIDYLYMKYHFKLIK